jgi:hypothetical protein
MTDYKDDQEDQEYEELREDAEDGFAKECAVAMQSLDKKQPSIAGVSFMMAVEKYLEKFSVPAASFQLCLRVPVPSTNFTKQHLENCRNAEFVCSISESATMWEVNTSVQAVALRVGENLMSRIDKIIGIWVEVPELGSVADRKTREHIAVTARFSMVLATSIRTWGHWFGPSSEKPEQENDGRVLDFWKTTISDAGLASTMAESKLLTSMLEIVMSQDEDGLDLELGDGFDDDLG